ncbi:MAG: hypothetical protein V1702_04840 [Candidatus Woesearchaeota archaeon]
MVGKKAYMKTAEAVIAIAITFTMLMAFMSQKSTTQAGKLPENFLDTLKDDQDFRSCVQSKDSVCINQSLDRIIPDSYSFTFNISEDPNAIVSEDLPEKRVYANAVLLSGNTTDSTIRIMRVFYWTK